jgi:imidazolonepropionase-like amidohydrolase
MSGRLTPLRLLAIALALAILLAAVLLRSVEPESVAAEVRESFTAWVGADIWTGDAGSVIEEGVLLVGEDGRVQAVGSRNSIDIPEGTRIVDLSGHYIVPGLINAHGHVGMARGLRTGPEVHSRSNVEAQLRLYARYGITTVVSLGDEPPQALDVRREQDGLANPQMARLYLTPGAVPAPTDPEAARAYVAAHAGPQSDWLKIRVDDQLGEAEAMPQEVHEAFIAAAHEHGEPVATHMVTLAHAKDLMRSGSDLLAHSVRDAEVDAELIELMREAEVCITPTLTREVSAYIYAERPAFFDDPFFLKHADPATVEALLEPDVQARFTGMAADYYREALPLAMRNMMALHEAGVRIAMGTDSGPPARFQGYFEHMEMAMMADAGMSPAEVLRSATRDAADCMGLGETLGTLAPGKWADFLVLETDPLASVSNLRSIVSVHIGGQPLH